MRIPISWRCRRRVAQNIGVTCECATLAIFVFFTPSKFGLSNFAPHAKSMLTLLRIGVPSGLQWFSDVLAWSVFCNGVMGLLGTSAMAANTFMLRYLVVCFMPAVGLQSAATALVGRYIGRQRPDIAASRAHLAFGISLIYVIICGSLIVIAQVADRAVLQQSRRHPHGRGVSDLRCCV